MCDKLVHNTGMLPVEVQVVIWFTLLRHHGTQEKEKRREELKRLKNLKKREIFDKIEKLKDVTGDVAVGFTEQDVEGEFNEREYDEMMRVNTLYVLRMFPIQCSDTVGWRREGHPACKKTRCWFVGGDILTRALHVL